MGNIEIISIVFGISALIVVILILVFRWLGIKVNYCCFNKEKIYTVHDFLKLKNNSNKNDSNFTQIWNSESALSVLSTNTFDTIINFDNDTTTHNIQSKPNLKAMTPCLDEKLLKIEFNNADIGKLEIELNYNPYVYRIRFDFVTFFFIILKI